MKKYLARQLHWSNMSLPTLLVAGIFFAYALPKIVSDAQAADKFKAGDTVTVNTAALNVRSDAGTGASVLGTQKINAAGIIKAGPKTAGGLTWWQIDYKTGADGWSADSFLRLGAPTITPTIPSTSTFQKDDKISVNATALNVRSDAGTGYAITGVQKKGASGKIIAGPKTANGNKWWQINYDLGADGWSAEAFLSKVASSPAAGPGTVSQAPLVWGAYAGNNPGNLEEFEKKIGKDVNIQAVFVGWNDPFPHDIASRLKRDGKTLLIFWEPYTASLESIDAGHSDEYMSAFAEQAKRYAAPIILAPLHEMNGNWNPWSGFGYDNRLINSPELIISVWRRMHRIFETAENVKFAWAINNDSVPDIPANAASVYYPGDAYVDYVGVDGFNFGTPWQKFNEVFDRSMAALAVYKKPIYLFSIASAPGRDKADWIKDGLGKRVKQYANIAGWVWFNQEGPDRNWSITSDPASLEAFKSIIP